jgi:hypothetical protein
MRLLFTIGTCGMSAIDVLGEYLAGGAVLWTEHWIRTAYPHAPSLIASGVRLGLPVGPALDCQRINLGPELLNEGEGACLELAIYEAGWRRAHGVDCGVKVGRIDGRIQSHAMVVEYDRGGEVVEWIDVARLLMPTEELKEVHPYV